MESYYGNNNWSTEEVAELEALHNLGLGNHEIGKILGRSWRGVRGKKYRMGLKVATRQDIIQTKYICEVLGVNHPLLKKYADLYGFPMNVILGPHGKAEFYYVYIDNAIKWFIDNERFLVDADSKLMLSEISNISNPQIFKLDELLKGKTLQKENREWTPAEESFIKSNYKTLEYSEIAKIINRTSSAVNHKVNRMNLVKRRTKKNK